jgi:hypothetical protein
MIDDINTLRMENSIIRQELTNARVELSYLRARVEQLQDEARPRDALELAVRKYLKIMRDPASPQWQTREMREDLERTLGLRK